MDYWKVLTILMTVFVAYVGYQQYRINREKFRLDLFEKRFSVFEATRKLISIALQDAKAEYKDLFEFRASVAEATFLFDKDITNYLDEIDKQYVHLHVTVKRSQGNDELETLDKVSDENAQILQWFADQLPKLEKPFSPYLKFKVWK